MQVDEIIRNPELLADMDTSEVDMILSGLGRVNPAQRRAVATAVKTAAQRTRHSNSFRAASNPAIHNQNITGRGEFQKHIGQLPENVRRELGQSGKLKLIDQVYYSVKEFSNRNRVELMASADTKKVGITNINNRKLEAGQYFLCTAIAVTVGTGTNAHNVVFDDLPALFRNGIFNMEVGGKKQLNEISMEIFHTATLDCVRKGYYKLDNPFFIPQQTEFIPEIELPEAAGANVWVKIQLIGVGLANR